MNGAPLGWLGIVRLGLVQAALGAIVVLTSSTLNRVMVVELALPATLPGLLVALHYAVQIMRPRIGHGSDVSGRRTPWIVGGMAVLASGGFLASVATAWMTTQTAGGIVLAVFAFILIGLGVGASGTSLLALLAKRVDDRKRAAASSIVWVMMIVGIVITAAVAGQLLDPFSPARLVAVTGGVAAAAFLVTLLAVWGVEGSAALTTPVPVAAKTPFRQAMAEVWAEPAARRFTIFVFVSMLAYSSQDLILEPFAGLLFGLTPGQSTSLASLQHGGVLLGMIVVAVGGSVIGGRWLGSLRMWTIGGCVASALALAGLAAAGPIGPAWPLRPSVFALGFANGVFAVAAIGSMMRLAGADGHGREGMHIGLWGAAQAIASGLGGLAGTAAVDIASFVTGSPMAAYATVFAGEALLFLTAAILAARVGNVPASRERTTATTTPGGAYATGHGGA